MNLTEEQLKQKLVFIHTPKCGGTYCNSILKGLNIQSNGHTRAIKNGNIHFTIIRDPVQRFESLLNYRLNGKKYRYDDTLNEIVSKMTDKQIMGFKPYKTLCYWSKNVDILITIDKLPELLKLFGHTYNFYEKANVSSKTRGSFNMNTKNRIKQLFKEDVLLFNKLNQGYLLQAI